MSSVFTCSKLVSSGKSLPLAAERENTSATLSLSSNSPGILYKCCLNATSAIVLTWHVLMCPGERPLNLYCTCKASLLLHCIQLLPGNKRTDEESCCFALWRPWLPSQGNVAHNKRNTCCATPPRSISHTSRSPLQSNAFYFSRNVEYSERNSQKLCNTMPPRSICHASWSPRQSNVLNFKTFRCS